MFREFFAAKDLELCFYVLFFVTLMNVVLVFF